MYSVSEDPIWSYLGVVSCPKTFCILFFNLAYGTSWIYCNHMWQRQAKPVTRRKSSSEIMAKICLNVKIFEIYFIVVNYRLYIYTSLFAVIFPIFSVKTIFINDLAIIFAIEMPEIINFEGRFHEYNSLNSPMFKCL